MHLVVLEVGDSFNPIAPPSDQLEVVELHEDRLDERIAAAIAEAGFYVHSVDGVRAKLRRGERCFVLLDEGTPATFFWVAVGEYYDRALKRRFDLGGGAYYVGGWTFEAYRGRSLLPYLADYALSRLGGHGDSSGVSVLVRSDNASSLRLCEKLGFEPTGDLHSVEIGAGIRFQWITGHSRMTAAVRRFHVDLAPTWLD